MDERWTHFYSKFVVEDQPQEISQNTARQAEPRYKLIPTLIALVFLSQGNAENKAKAIADLYSDHSFFLPGITNVAREQLGSSIQSKLNEKILPQKQLKTIVTIFINVALILLPLFSADYPGMDMRDYTKHVIQWQERAQQVINHYMQEFYGGQFSSKFSGSISVSQFIERSRALDIFNVLQIREVAKKTIFISDHNPEINRDAVLKEGLFAENLGKK